MTKSAGIVAWLRLARIYQKIAQAATTQLRAFGLSLAQFDVLAQVGASDGLTQQMLADRLLVTKGNVSQLVDKLEHAGLIIRMPEGRVCRLHLTAAGRSLYKDVVPAHEAFVDHAFSALTREEQAQLAQLLRTLDRSLMTRHNFSPISRAGRGTAGLSCRPGPVFTLRPYACLSSERRRSANTTSHQKEHIRGTGWTASHLIDHQQRWTQRYLLH